MPAYGGFYAFPGGMIDVQDLAEEWEKVYPQYMSQFSYEIGQVPDFAKKMAAVRELYEECNLFIGNMSGKVGDESKCQGVNSDLI